MGDASAELRRQFAALANDLKNLTPVLPQIGKIMLASVRRNFAEHGRFGSGDLGGGSQRWPISEAASRERRGTLEKSGRLRDSFRVQIEGNKLAITSDAEYAAIHQYGGSAGRGGSVRIKATPIVVVQEEDLVAIETAIAEYYQKIIGE